MLPNLSKEERMIMVALGPSNTPQFVNYISDETGISRVGVIFAMRRMHAEGLATLTFETLPPEQTGLREPRRMYSLTDLGRLYLLPINFLQICREECVRATLTSHPLKYEFMAQRNLTSLDAVHEWMQKTRKEFVEAVAIYGGKVE